MATVKIATLLIKSLAKPIATKIKTQAKNHPAFKKFCVDVAQRSHRMEMSLKMRFMDYKIKNVRPLEEERAVEQGATFISEFILFSVGIGTILGEQWRSSRSKSRAKKDIDVSLVTLQGDLEELNEKFNQSQQQFEKEVVLLRQDNANVLNTLTKVLESMKTQEHFNSNIVNILKQNEAQQEQLDKLMLAEFTNDPTFWERITKWLKSWIDRNSDNKKE